MLEGFAHVPEVRLLFPSFIFSMDGFQDICGSERLSAFLDIYTLTSLACACTHQHRGQNSCSTHGRGGTRRLRRVAGVGRPQCTSLARWGSCVWSSRKVKHVCDKKCNKESIKFFDIVFILVEDGGRPHTISLCRHCYVCRRQSVAKQKMTSAVWQDMELNGALWNVLGNLGRD